MKVAFLSILLVILSGCQTTDGNIATKPDNKTVKTPEPHYFKITYSDDDNEFRVKNPLVISAILPYNVKWTINNTETDCATLKRHRGDSYKLMPRRQVQYNCEVNLSGVVLNSYGEEVSLVSQKLIIQQAVPANTHAQWLSSSWGVRFAIPGGADLTASNSDFQQGSKQLVDELSTFGHVMLNLTANAKGFRYLLRENEYIDIAKEIHPDLVPSKDKEKTLFDVIKVFKDHNKKVILYIAADGPAAYMLQRHGRSDPELEKAWEDYYTKRFNGDEGEAWRTLLKGFLVRLKGKVDGYWIDHVDHMPGELDDFIAMIKSVDSSVVIGLNRGKNYIKNSNNSYIRVAADKHGALKKPYRVVSLTPQESYSDFTSGHPTPLAYGAKPNAWAYEEFTFNEVEHAPWIFYKNKPVLRHWFGPMRTGWNHGELLFNTEQAYRFVRRLTDAGGAITWANTVNAGAINPQDLAVLKEVDAKMAKPVKPPYATYKRPEHAALINN